MLIVEGGVKLYLEDHDGNEFFIYQLGPGSACALSIICATKKEQSRISARVVEPTRAVLVPIALTDELMTRYKLVLFRIGNVPVSETQNSEVLGFSASILIGISLGLTGGGGSILTLPVLVYVMGINPVLSTAYSLFVVGTTSLAGSFNFMRKGLVNYKAALVFAIPSFFAVFLTRKFWFR